jgi:hypothetical protein
MDMPDYTIIIVILLVLLVSAFFFVLGFRAIASTIEDSISSYADSNYNVLIAKAVVFIFLALVALLLSIKMVGADSILLHARLLQETCNDKDPVKHAACMGFTAGVANSYLASGQMCIPPNTDPKEVTDFVRTYMNRNANLLNQSAAGIVLLALKARYPCLSGGPRITFQFRGF